MGYAEAMVILYNGKRKNRHTRLSLSALYAKDGKPRGRFEDEVDGDTKEKRTEIVVLDMPLLDTRSGRDLTGTFIADIVLQLLSYVAQREREFIRQRQREGIEAAKERGVHFGRNYYERPANYGEIVRCWKERSITAKEGSEQLGVSLSCI